jgi:hypothetical protein
MNKEKLKGSFVVCDCGGLGRLGGAPHPTPDGPVPTAVERLILDGQMTAMKKQPMGDDTVSSDRRIIGTIYPTV